MMQRVKEAVEDGNKLMNITKFFARHVWLCNSCGAKLNKPRWVSYTNYEKVWEKHHADRQNVVHAWEKAAKDPQRRCPRCGGISNLPKNLGIPCASCSMRYSPVTTRRFKPMHEFPFSIADCEP